MGYQFQPPPRLYRVHYGPEPLRLRDWSAARSEDRLGKKTFGHRWDDPEREFRSLYCADSAIMAIVETIQDIMPSPGVIAALQQLTLEPGENLPPVGEIPSDLFENNYLCTLLVEPSTQFVDVLQSEILSRMRCEHSNLCARFGLPPVDAAMVLGNNFELTQAIARSVYSAGFAGIKASSKFGRPHENWTIFEAEKESERFRVGVTLADVPIKLTAEHPDLIEALNIFGLRLDSTSMLLHYQPPESPFKLE